MPRPATQQLDCPGEWRETLHELQTAARVVRNTEQRGIKAYVSMLRDGELVNSSFNRRECWHDAKKKLLIHSLFKSPNLAILCWVPADSAEPKELFDGGNRSRALREYVGSELAVKVGPSDKELLFKELPVAIKRHILNNVPVYLTSISNCDRSVASQVARSLNQGLQHTQGEHAISLLAGDGALATQLRENFHEVFARWASDEKEGSRMADMKWVAVGIRNALKGPPFIETLTHTVFEDESGLALSERQTQTLDLLICAYDDIKAARRGKNWRTRRRSRQRGRSTGGRRASSTESLSRVS